MVVEHKFSNTSAVSIVDLLRSNTRFTVPKFQRNYSWDVDKAENLWSDMMENFNIVKKDYENTREIQYLLGPIVLVKDGDKDDEYLVIDGQQRLSTLTMLFCVARDILLENVKTGANTKPKGVEEIMTLIQNTRMGKRTGWKLQLNDTDKDLFEKIQEFEDDPQSQLERMKKQKTKTKSEKQLKNNYIFLHEKIMECMYTKFGDKSLDLDSAKAMSDRQKQKLITDSIDMLNYFVTHIVENNFVVKIMVSDDTTAYQIFETLNERGQTLSKSNLIKNHILNQVKNKDKQQDLSKKWNTIFDEIIGQGQRDDEFIMESLRSRDFNTTSKISLKNLYKIIKIKIKDQRSCIRYIEELEEDAGFLTMLNEPKIYDDNKTEDDIYAIKALDAKFIRTPILAAYRRWGINKKEYREVVKILVKFFFKYRVVRQMHPGDVERVIMKITKMIVDKKSFKAIIGELKKNDDHEDFNYNFKKKFVLSPANAAKYVLYQITMHLGTPHDDVRPIEGLTLEHILPQKTREWNKKEFFEGYNKTDKKIDEFVPYLGNMTLLKHAINTKIKNFPFKDKKCNIDSDGKRAGYLASQLKINTKTVWNHDQWNAKIIEARGSKFAEYADKIWNLDSN